MLTNYHALEIATKVIDQLKSDEEFTRNLDFLVGELMRLSKEMVQNWLFSGKYEFFADFFKDFQYQDSIHDVLGLRRDRRRLSYVRKSLLRSGKKILAFPKNSWAEFEGVKSIKQAFTKVFESGFNKMVSV